MLEGLFEHSRLRLAAMALTIIMRAIVDGVQMGPVRREMFCQPLVHVVQICVRVQSQGDAPLVGDHNHFAPGAVELRDRLLDTGQHFELLPGSDEGANRTPIQHSVPIQENVGNICKISGALAVHHGYNRKQ